MPLRQLQVGGHGVDGVELGGNVFSCKAHEAAELAQGDNAHVLVAHKAHEVAHEAQEVAHEAQEVDWRRTIVFTGVVDGRKEGEGAFVEKIYLFIFWLQVSHLPLTKPFFRNKPPKFFKKIKKTYLLHFLRTLYTATAAFFRRRCGRQEEGKRINKQSEEKEAEAASSGESPGYGHHGHHVKSSVDWPGHSHHGLCVGSPGQEWPGHCHYGCRI